MVAVESKSKILVYKPEVQQTNMTSVNETCQSSHMGHVLIYNNLRMHFCLYSLPFKRFLKTPVNFQNMPIFKIL